MGYGTEVREGLRVPTRELRTRYRRCTRATSNSMTPRWSSTVSTANAW
jgi:hypothetical protein